MSTIEEAVKARHYVHVIRRMMSNGFSACNIPLANDGVDTNALHGPSLTTWAAREQNSTGLLFDALLSTVCHS
jgi:hypothetical protein